MAREHVIAEVQSSGAGVFEPRGASQRLFKTRDFETIVAGPAECLAWESLIWDPIADQHIPIGLLADEQRSCHVMTLQGPQAAEVPFLKGTGPLYRVTCENGSSFVGSARHKVMTFRAGMTPNPWCFVGDLKVGDELRTPDNGLRMWTPVKSVEFEREDHYYDLTVPNGGHYISEMVTHSNTGKTYGCLQYLHLLMLTFPNAKGAIVRRTYASLVSSALQTYKRIIGPDSGIQECGGESLAIAVYGGEKPEFFQYPNGSRVYIIGLDNADKVLSSERDFIYVNQAEELFETDWEKLSTRCTGRGSQIPWEALACEPYSRLFGDCNPGPSSHWIKRRQSVLLLESRHEDNPTLFTEDGETTKQGVKSIGALDKLTGVLKQRLRFGRWVNSEGAVYPEWDPAVHVLRYNSPEFPYPCIPPEWARAQAIDFGYNNPFVCLWGARDGDGRIYVYRQIYMSKRLVSDHAQDIYRESQGETYQFSTADHDAEGRATLERCGIVTEPAYKAILPGIENVQQRLQIADDGKPRLFVMEHSLVEMDEELHSRRHPTCLEQEMEVYTWRLTVEGKPVKEVPVDMYDHGMDSLKYLCARFDNLAAGVAQSEPGAVASLVHNSITGRPSYGNVAIRDDEHGNPVIYTAPRRVPVQATQDNIPAVQNDGVPVAQTAQPIRRGLFGDRVWRRY